MGGSGREKTEALIASLLGHPLLLSLDVVCCVATAATTDAAAVDVIDIPGRRERLSSQGRHLQRTPFVVVVVAVGRSRRYTYLLECRLIE